nr:retrovirus-related Pol polyprotein from transposon TNT 1-94 [Tanacetum cinerariifolium]
MLVIPNENVILKVSVCNKYVIDVEPIPPSQRNNRNVQHGYLNCLNDTLDTLYEIVKEARNNRTSDNSLEYVYVKQLNEPKTNVPAIPSTGVNSVTKASRSQPKSNKKIDRTLTAKSKHKKNVEAYLTNNKSDLHKKNRVDYGISFKHAVVNLNSNSHCKTCNKCMISFNHDECVAKNFMKQFIGAVRFGNDHSRAIIGYGYYVIGDSMISRVYYVEGLGHNLFSVGQFCDSDLEVAFLKHTCFVRDLDGVDLIKGTRGTNLYTIFVEDMMRSSPIFLLSKASKNKSWLWHRRLNHLNFGTINDLAQKDLVHGLPRIKFEKDHLCSACQLGKSKKFTWVKFLITKDETLEVIIKLIKRLQVKLNNTIRNIRTDNGTGFVNRHLIQYYESVGISHQKSVPRTPSQQADHVPVFPTGTPASFSIEEDAPSTSISSSSQHHPGKLVQQIPIKLLYHMNISGNGPTLIRLTTLLGIPLDRTINMGLWYPKDTAMAYVDADHAGCQDTRKSTSGSAQFLAPAMAPPTRTDDQILPRSSWSLHYFLDNSIDVYSAVWDTVQYVKNTMSYSYQLDEQSFDLNKNTLRDALQITQVDNNISFSSPPTPNVLINFVNDLGYPKERMWEEFTQSIHSFIKDKNNLALHTQRKKKANPLVIPSVRFTKLIVHHLQSKHKFHPRPDSPINFPFEEYVLGYLKFSAKGTKQEVFGMPILNDLITIDIIVAKSLKDVHPTHWGPLPPVVFREPDSQRRQPLPEVQGKGKDKLIEEQGGPYPGDSAESRPLPSQGIHTGSSLDPVDEGFITTAYPNVQENLKLMVEEETITETKAKSMVSVTIQQDTSDIPPMKTSMIDLTSKPDSPKCIGELEQIMANLIQDNKHLEERDSPEADMKEILHQQMWETNSYQANEDHKNLYEAQEKSMVRDQTNQFLTDLAEARRKKKMRHDSPKTPHGSPPHQPPPPSPQAALSSSRIATSAEYTAWTTSDTRFKLSVSSIPEDLHMDDDLAPDK